MAKYQHGRTSLLVFSLQTIRRREPAFLQTGVICLSKKYVLALDQGTTSSRAVIFDGNGNNLAMTQHEFSQIFPKPGWVEHNAEEIWSNQIGTAAEVLAKASLSPAQISGIGITNQRETTVVWDIETGRPVYNAIVWQCRRTADYCEQLKAQGLEKIIRQKTGLVVDAYFSGPKVKWILDNVAGARAKAAAGNSGSARSIPG